MELTSSDPQPGTDLNPAAVDVLLALGGIVRHVRHSPLRIPQHLQAEFQNAGLGQRHLTALLHIAEHGPLTAGALADHLDVSAPSVSEVITDLARSGLVNRCADPADGRRTLLSTTTDHQHVVQHLLNSRLVPISRALAQLNPDQQAALVDGLRILGAELRAGPNT